MIYVDNSLNVQGRYDDVNHKIYINVDRCQREGILDHVIRHEIMHHLLITKPPQINQEALCNFYSDNIDIVEQLLKEFKDSLNG